MYKSTFDRIGYQIEALQIDCDKQEVYYKTMITTHEVTIGQQSIQLKKLEEQIALDKLNAQDYARTIVDLEDKLVKAQETVEDNVQTILRLQMELKTSDAEVDSLLELNEILYGKYSNTIDACPCCNNDVSFDGELRHVLSDTTASGRGMIQYPFNPEGKPEPYPYTHPIRDIPDYSKVKVK